MKIKRDWIINNGWLVFFIGFFVANTDNDIASFIGVGLMLFSFYLMHLSKKK
jgi:hypothetical protein